MRALRVVGLGIDGRTVILETVEQRSGERRERFTLPADEGLHAAVRGDLPRLGQIEIELESQMRPREIQARIRAGASVEQVAAAAGVPTQKVERFAYPVLLERSRTAQLAQQAHPVRADGPDVRTLEEVVSETFAKRGHDYEAVTWDSWRGENGKWVVQLRWRAGRSDIKAHWTFHPGAHGGTVTAIDDHATDLIDPQPAAQLRPVAPVTPLPGSTPGVPCWEPPYREQSPAPSQRPAHPDSPAEVPGAEEQRSARAVPDDGPAYHPARPSERPAERPTAERPPTERPPEQHQQPASQPPPAAQPPAAKRGRKDRPIVPSWEDVLLGVRSPRE
ncbi:MAG TPA: septation protein SepH [Pseudonocardiaceae bacterium]|nr:septation protein SepH [Pseudonocardiaceae bacterium]